MQRGQIQLRKVSAAPRTQSPAVDLRSNLMSAIRQGVALRKVSAVRTSTPNSSDSDLQSSIRAAMMRMKKVATDSDEDDRGDDELRSADWES